MKLNLFIILDELQNKSGQIICDEDINSHLESIRYGASAENILSERYLYLVDAEFLSCLPAKSGKFSFVVFGEIAQSYLKDRGWSAIQLPRETDRHQVFNKIQDIFDQYAQWERDMLLMITKDEPLQEIFNCAARFLDNPIALFDSSLSFIMKAGVLPEDIKNTIWEEVLTKGYSRMEALSIEEQRLIANLLTTKNEPFFYQSRGEYSSHRQIVASFKRNDVLIGTLGMIDILKPFTLGQLSIVFHLKNFMELVFKKDFYLSSTLEDASYFVERLLQGLAVEKAAVEYHLNKRKWPLKDSYTMLYFVRKDGSPIDTLMIGMVSFRLRSFLRETMVLQYENGILAICHREDPARLDQAITHELSMLLQNTGLRCGVSLSFYDFMHLKYAFIQCKTALADSQKDSERLINLFETQYTNHIIQGLGGSTSLKSLCHPLILRLFDDEGEKGLDFIRNLQIYLINGRNTTAAAAMLFIHRNTLIYRLNRIEEILGIKLDSADEQTLFMLYLSCLIVNSFFANR